MQFSPSSCYFLSLRSKYSPQRPVLKYVNICSFQLVLWNYGKSIDDEEVTIGWGKLHNEKHNSYQKKENDMGEACSSSVIDNKMLAGKRERKRSFRRT
jgi:hypothetical protein